MIDHDASHQSKMIMSYQYSYFFEDLAKSQRGKVVRIEKGGDVRTTEVPRDQVVLEGLDYSHSSKGEMVTVSTNDPEQPEFRVSFNLVWAVFDREENVVAAEFSDEHNRKVVLRFE
jgi:hypothetical protein